MRNRAALSFGHASAICIVWVGAAMAQENARSAIERLQDIAPALDQCVGRELRTEGLGRGHDATFGMAFRRDGGLIGAPRITYSSPPRDDAGQKRFIAAVDRAFRLCTPLPFSNRLGGAIAGKIFTFRYTLTDAKDESP